MAGQPGHDLARFLHHELERRGWSVKDFHAALQSHGFDKEAGAVGKWVEGRSTPRFNDQAAIAKALGYQDWFALVAAVARFVKRT